MLYLFTGFAGNGTFLNWFVGTVDSKVGIGWEGIGICEGLDILRLAVRLPETDLCVGVCGNPRLGDCAAPIDGIPPV